MDVDSPTCPKEKRAQLASYLRRQVESGEVWFKSSRIAQDLGMTPKEVGSNLVYLQREVEDLTIEKWARASRSTTWLIEPAEA